MTTNAGTRLRADAQRNRDQIVAAAKVLFVAAGLDVPMEEIARGAGVGVGTLYRRFPDRERLISAVVRECFVDALHDARLAAAAGPTAWDALVHLLVGSRDLRLSIRLAVLSRPGWASIRDDPEIRELRENLLGVLDELVRTAQADDVLRADVGTGDVGLVVYLLFRHNPADAEALSGGPLERAVVLMLDGMRVHPGTPLPGHPVTAAELEGYDRE